MSFNRRTGSGAIDDATSELYDTIKSDVRFPLGKPVSIKGSRPLEHGNFYSVDTDIGDTDLKLPKGRADRVGEVTTLRNAGHSMIYARVSPGDLIAENWEVYPIPPSIPVIQFILIEPNRWMYVGGPKERVWAEWNGVNLSQVDLVDVGTEVSSSTMTLEYGNSKKFSIQLDVTGSTSNVLQTAAAALFKKRPPTKDYRVTYWGTHSTLSGSTCDSIAVLRYQSQGNFIGSVCLINGARFGLYKMDAGTASELLRLWSMGQYPAATPTINLTGHGHGQSVEVYGECNVRQTEPANLVYFEDSSTYDPAGRCGVGVRGNNAGCRFRIYNMKVELLS